MESPPPQIKDGANLRQKPGHAGVTVMQWARIMFSNSAAIPINRIPVHSATILKRANYKAIHNILRVRRTLARFLHLPSKEVKSVAKGNMLENEHAHSLEFFGR